LLLTNCWHTRHYLLLLLLLALHQFCLCFV
jgi:hypothetical protein